MSGVVLAGLLWSCLTLAGERQRDPVVPADPERVHALRLLEAPIRGRAQVSDDGARVLWFAPASNPSAGSVHLRASDVRTGTELDVAERARWTAACFAPGGEALFVCEERGVLHRLDLARGTTEQVLALPEPRAADHVTITNDGRFLAWSHASSGRAGVLDVREGKRIADFENVALPPGASADVPRIAFTPDQRAVCFHVTAPNSASLRVLGHERGGLVVFDLDSGRSVALLETYAPRQTPGFACSGARIVHAVRVESSRWELLAWDRTIAHEVVLAPKLRGGHFVDLFAAPSGRFVVEWDFEERRAGLDVYALDDGSTRRGLGAGATFLGFDAAADREAVLLVDDPRVLESLDLATGRCVRRIEAEGSGRWESAVTLLDGSRLLSVSLESDAIDGSWSRHLSLHELVR